MPRNAVVKAPRPSFPGMVAGEAVKLSRQRSLYAILGAGVLLFAMVVLATTTASNLAGQLRASPLAWAHSEMDVFGLLGQIGTGIVVLIAASRLFGMEYSSGTIRILLARGAGRLQLALAKFLVLWLFGLATTAVYLMLAVAVCAVFVQVQRGSLDPLTGLPGAFFQDMGRWAVVQLVSVAMAVLIAWVSAALGRSLAFAMGVALAVYPATNFLDIILVLGRTATHQEQPWASISDTLLGGQMNVLLRLWEPDHWSTAGFATPMDQLSLGQDVLGLAIWAAVMLAVACYRTVAPDVLE